MSWENRKGKDYYNNYRPARKPGRLPIDLLSLFPHTQSLTLVLKALTEQ